MAASPLLSLVSVLCLFLFHPSLVSCGFLNDLFNLGARSPSSSYNGPPKFADCSGCDERARKCHQYINISSESICDGLPEPSTSASAIIALGNAPKLDFGIEKLDNLGPQSQVCASIPTLQKDFQTAKQKRDDLYKRYKELHSHYEQLSQQATTVKSKFEQENPIYQDMAKKRTEVANKLQNVRAEYEKAKFDCEQLRPQDVDACSEFLVGATKSFKESDKFDRKIDFLQTLKQEKLAVIERTKTILKHLEYIIAKEIVSSKANCEKFTHTLVEETAKVANLQHQLHNLPNSPQTIEKRTELADQLTQLETDVDKLGLVVSYVCHGGVTNPNVLAIDRLLEARSHPDRNGADPTQLVNALDFAIETENRDRSNVDDLKRLQASAKNNAELSKFYNLIEQLREAQCKLNRHFCDVSESVQEWLDERLVRYQAQVVKLDNILRELYLDKTTAEEFKSNFDELLVTKFDHCDAVLAAKVKYYGELIALLRKEGQIFSAILNSFFGDAFPSNTNEKDKDNKEKAQLRVPLENMLKAVNVDEFWKEFNYGEKRRPHKLSDFSLDSFQKFLLAAKDYVLHVNPFITDASHADVEQLFAKWQTNALTDIKTINRSIDVFSNHVLIHLDGLKMSAAFNPANRQPHGANDKFDVLSKSLDDFGKRVPLKSIDKLHCVFFSKEGDSCPSELRGLTNNGKVAQFESERRAYSSFYDLLLDPKKIADELKNVDFKKRQEENVIKQANYDKAKAELIQKLRPCDVISLQNQVKVLDNNITKNAKGVTDLLTQLNEVAKKKSLFEAELVEKKNLYKNSTQEVTQLGKKYSDAVLVCAGLLDAGKAGFLEKVEVKIDARGSTSQVPSQAPASTPPAAATQVPPTPTPTAAAGAAAGATSKQ